MIRALRRGEIITEQFEGGPVGINSLAAALSEERGTVEDVIEPYLIQQGLIARTARGRIATAKTWQTLGLKPPTKNNLNQDIFFLDFHLNYQRTNLKSCNP